jgi:MFS family permease
MSRLPDLIRHEARARVFLLAYLQSSLGTGAGYVALIVVAYARFHSPWAITLILLADFLPSMLLGPLAGAMADRFSRRWCAVAADVVRAVAFIGLALVGSFAATLALAVLAGFGTALFSPSILAALPSLVRKDRVSAATSLYGSVTTIGRTIGPMLAAVALPLAGADAVMIGNGVTFAVSAAVLTFIGFGERLSGDQTEGDRGLVRSAVAGVRATAAIGGVRVVLFASTAIILFAAMLNVAELLLARELHAGTSGYSVLIAVLGIGVVIGSLMGTRGDSPPELKSRYLGGLAIVALGLVLLSVAPVYAAALPAFFVIGLGNGLVVVHERLLFQHGVPAGLLGRAFAALDALGSWAFAIAFVAAGGLISAIGTRPLLAVSGAGTLAVWAVAAAALRTVWTAPGEPAAQPLARPEPGPAS